jgi:hypothetical protein
MASNEIDLLPGVSFNVDSNVAAKIDNCSGVSDYSTFRQAARQPLSQNQIDSLMNDLNRGLYNAPAQAKEKISRLLVYPNPANNVLNISYNDYIKKKVFLPYMMCWVEW